MDTQLAIVAVAITLAAVYIVRSTWRTWFGAVEEWM